MERSTEQHDSRGAAAQNLPLEGRSLPKDGFPDSLETATDPFNSRLLPACMGSRAHESTLSALFPGCNNSLH